jgi:lipid-A-disaccharide synthase
LQEIKYHGKIFAKAILKLKKRVPDLNIIIPTFPRFESDIKNIFDGLGPLILKDPNDKKEILPYVDAALVKSGTSSLETAHYRIPTTVAYRMNPITYWYIKSKVQIKYVSLVNILENEQVFDELIQGKCTAKNICDSLYKILNTSQDDVMKKCDKAFSKLSSNAKFTPSQVAAKALKDIIGII